MAIEHTGKQAQNTDISRETKTPAEIKRSEALATRFGWGKFGTGKFSRKKIQRGKL